jgi:hypothetical protein
MKMRWFDKKPDLLSADGGSKEKKNKMVGPRRPLSPYENEALELESQLNKSCAVIENSVNRLDFLRADNLRLETVQLNIQFLERLNAYAQCEPVPSKKVQNFDVVYGFAYATISRGLRYQSAELVELGLHFMRVFEHGRQSSVGIPQSVEDAQILSQLEQAQELINNYQTHQEVFDPARATQIAQFSGRIAEKYYMNTDRQQVEDFLEIIAMASRLAVKAELLWELKRRGITDWQHGLSVEWRLANSAYIVWNRKKS